MIKRSKIFNFFILIVFVIFIILICYYNPYVFKVLSPFIVTISYFVLFGLVFKFLYYLFVFIFYINDLLDRRKSWVHFYYLLLLYCCYLIEINN